MRPCAVRNRADEPFQCRRTAGYVRYDGGRIAAAEETELPDIPEFERSRLLAMEKEVTGLYMSGHPLESRSADIRAIGAVPLARLHAEDSEYGDGDYITAAGILGPVRLKTTKSNSMMAYTTLED